MMNQRKRWPGSRRTEIAYENCLCSIRRPFPVNDRRVLIDDETEFEKAFSKRVVASFMLLYGVLPLYEGLMPASNGRKKGFQPRIEFEYGFLVERHAKKINWAVDSNTRERPDVIALSDQRHGETRLIGLCCAQFTHPICHVTLPHWFRA